MIWARQGHGTDRNRIRMMNGCVSCGYGRFLSFHKITFALFRSFPSNFCNQMNVRCSCDILQSDYDNGYDRVEMLRNAFLSCSSPLLLNLIFKLPIKDMTLRCYYEVGIMK